MFSHAKSRIEKVKVSISHGVQLPLSDSSGDCGVLVPRPTAPRFLRGFDFCIRRDSPRAVPGATMMIHLPIYNWPLSRGLVGRLFRIRAMDLTLQGRGLPNAYVPMMRGTWHEVGWVRQMLFVI